VLYSVGDFNRLNSLGLQLITVFLKLLMLLVLILWICDLPIYKSIYLNALLLLHQLFLIIKHVICGGSDDKIVDAAKPKSRKAVKFNDIHDQHMSRFYTALASSNWNHVLQDNDVYSFYSSSVKSLQSLIDQFIPNKQITITDSSCPSFITPLIKSLLRKRNRLLRKSQVSRASELSSKIGKLIAERRSESLSSINPRSSKELW
jgi:hypothetical protein